MMSMHGKVADFQIWNEALTDDQLLKVTSSNHQVSEAETMMLGDRVPGVPPGQLSQLGKCKLVSQLQSWHGNWLNQLCLFPFLSRLARRFLI